MATEQDAPRVLEFRRATKTVPPAQVPTLSVTVPSFIRMYSDLHRYGELVVKLCDLLLAGPGLPTDHRGTIEGTRTLMVRDVAAYKPELLEQLRAMLPKDGGGGT